MLMSRLPLLLLAVPVAGCASFADLADEQQVKIVDLVNVVRCELRGAVSDRPALGGWAATISLELKGISTGTASADASIVIPLSPGSFSFGLKSGRTETATNTGSFAVEELDLSTVPCTSSEGPHPANILTGDIGLQTWVVHVVDTTTAIGRPTKEIVYEVILVIKRNSEGSAKLSMIPVGSATAAPGATLAGDLSRSQKVTVALKPQAPTPAQTKKSLDDALQRFFFQRNID